MASVEKPKLKFKGTKIAMASKAMADTMLAEDQTSDITTFTRAPDMSVSNIVLEDRKEKEEEKKLKQQQQKVASVAKIQQPKKSLLSAKETYNPFNNNDELNFGVIEQEEQEEKSVDLTQYNDELQDLAVGILGEEKENPYVDKSENPIFPIQNRLGFQTQILKVFGGFAKIPEGKPIDYDACKKIASGQQQQVEMYQYQQFVREYIRQATPYRGILVYHGLGSGKTCSAIAAAEAVFSTTNKKIIVMTPSSLRDNFIREVSFCGFRHFRLQNHWVPFNADDPTAVLFAKEVLNLNKKFKKEDIIWIPDFKEKPNFDDLDPEEQAQVTKQIQEQITNRIDFISYNGITAIKLREIACNYNNPQSQYYKYFDNKVIIVDEIHNMTRLMQGVIEPYLMKLPGKKGRSIPFEPITPEAWEPALCKIAFDKARPLTTNYKRGYFLYRFLATARNSKIIGLSGTPLINFPEEIGILSNLLAGYMSLSSFSVKPGSEQNRKLISQVLREHPLVDFEEVKVEGTNLAILFTLLPEGMIKVKDSLGITGVQQNIASSSATSKNISEVTNEIIAELSERGMSVVRPPTFRAEPLLPPVGDVFREHFLTQDGKSLKNKLVLAKRLQGLISYYKGSKKELMPFVTKDEVIRVPMSSYSQAEYQRVRLEELKVEMQKKQKQGAADISVNKLGELWAQIYQLSTSKQSNSYRMYSRQACNFTFPENVTRPRPKDVKDITAEFGDDKVLLDDLANDQAPSKDTNFPIPGEKEDVQMAEAEDEAFEQDERKQEIEVDSSSSSSTDISEEEDTALLIPTLPANIGTMSETEIIQSTTSTEKKTLTKAQDIREKVRLKKLAEMAQCKAGILPGEKYEVAIRRAKNCLSGLEKFKLRLFPLNTDIMEEIEKGTQPDPERLMKYSPKFANMLIKILEKPGSSLVYSQFLEMEGIGIFLEVLKVNYFDSIMIEKDGAGSYRFTDDTIESLKKGVGVNRFLSFTGKEERDIRTLALKVFNGKFSELPGAMSEVLQESGFTSNLYGELCRVFCITSAGAEGLSLKNVRRVHIMEPYWNHVRTDQVKGRAVRICSHVDLDWNEDPELNERTVEVYTYCSVYADHALLHPNGNGGYPLIDETIKNGDGMKPEEAKAEGYPIPNGAKEYIVTSDEYMYSLSERKKKLLGNIQDLMKSAAVDCQINQYENEEEGIACLKLPNKPEQYAYHPILTEDIKETATYLREAPTTIKAPTTQMQAPSTEAEEEQGYKPFTQMKPKATTLKATIIVANGKRYLAVPMVDKATGLVSEYALYSEGDIRRVRRLGTSIADAQGRPTSDILLI
jgi:hypothetical protein